MQMGRLGYEPFGDMGVQASDLDETGDECEDINVRSVRHSIFGLLWTEKLAS